MRVWRFLRWLADPLPVVVGMVLATVAELLHRSR